MAPITAVSRRIHSQPKTTASASASNGAQGKHSAAQKAPAAHAQPVANSSGPSDVGYVQTIFPESLQPAELQSPAIPQYVEAKHGGGDKKSRTPSRFDSPDENLQLYQYSDLPRIGKDKLERAGRQLYNAAYDDNVINAKEAATLYARFGQAYFSVPDTSRNRNQRALDYILNNADGEGDDLFQFDSNQTKRNFQRMVTLFGLGADPQDTEGDDPTFEELQARLNTWAYEYPDLQQDVQRLDSWVTEHVYEAPEREWN